jgi:hypothetical protein
MREGLVRGSSLQEVCEMAFTVTYQHDIMSTHEVVTGTYVSDSGSTGGEIATGLNHIDGCIIQEWGSAVITSAPVVNESFPLAGGSITIVTVANKSGSFIAWGN